MHNDNIPFNMVYFIHMLYVYLFFNYGMYIKKINLKHFISHMMLEQGMRSLRHLRTRLLS